VLVETAAWDTVAAFAVDEETRVAVVVTDVVAPPPPCWGTACTNLARKSAADVIIEERMLKVFLKIA
jgi:hypothetical protein